MVLTVHIHSFGYLLSGIPADPSGHGGGFVFDCRGLPNPGRETVYQSMTGLDALVREYMNLFPEVRRFAETSAALVQQTIQSYQEQQFTHLMVSFGCTGGQHRSVYQTELLKQQLSGQEGLIVQVTHLEQQRWPQQNSI